MLDFQTFFWGDEVDAEEEEGGHQIPRLGKEKETSCFLRNTEKKLPGGDKSRSLTSQSVYIRRGGRVDIN